MQRTRLAQCHHKKSQIFALSKSKLIQSPRAYLNSCLEQTLCLGCQFEISSNSIRQWSDLHQLELISEIVRCFNLSGFVASTKSKILPCLCIGSSMSCQKFFFSNRTSHRDEENDESAERLYQLMSGTLKSPVIIVLQLVERDSSV